MELYSISTLALALGLVNLFVIGLIYRKYKIMKNENEARECYTPNEEDNL